MGKVIAIDGPAGAGKSTVSKLLAAKLSYRYLDTGAMYRGITYLVLKNNISIDEIDKIKDLCKDINIDFMPAAEDEISHIYINGIDLTDEIRNDVIDKNVSSVAKIKSVRDTMVKIQQKIARKGSIIVDGRDIGSSVLPDADIKFFLTASLDERARRRWSELKEKANDLSLEEIKKEIFNRDKQDSERKLSPLVKTSDAMLIDTSNLSIEEVVEKMINIVKGEDNV